MRRAAWAAAPSTLHAYGEWPWAASHGKWWSLMTAKSKPASTARATSRTSCFGPPARTSSCSRSGSWRSSLLFERARDDGQVQLAETLINGLLPFAGQAGKHGEPAAAGRNPVPQRAGDEDRVGGRGE